MLNNLITNKSRLIILAFLIAQSMVGAQSLSTLPYEQESVSSISTIPNHYFAFTQGLNNWKLGLPSRAQSALKVSPPSLLETWHTSKTALPNAYNVDHLAFFCRLEVHLEKATKIPVRFRLGDVQQVDYLENKFTGWRYGY